MSIKRDVQTLVYLKQQEKEQKTIEEQQQKELEQLKKDIINIIDFVLDEPIQEQKDILHYYLNNKNELIDDIYLKLLDIKIIIEDKKNRVVSDTGLLKAKKNKISKYKGYNEQRLKDFINDLLIEYVKKWEKEQQQKEKSNNQEQVNTILDNIIGIYEHSNKDNDVLRGFKTDKGLDLVLNYCNIEKSTQSIFNYKKALKCFLNNYIIEEHESTKAQTKNKRTIAGLSLPVALFGGVLGIFEAVQHNKR